MEDVEESTNHDDEVPIQHHSESVGMLINQQQNEKERYDELSISACKDTEISD